MSEHPPTILPFQTGNPAGPATGQTFFTREELMAILNIYGRMVAAGHWKDYAMNAEKDRACFAIFRRASERPLYQITKTPRLGHRQGAFALLAAQGQILKRGHDLGQLLKYFDRRRFRLVP